MVHAERRKTWEQYTKIKYRVQNSVKYEEDIKVY